MKLDSLLALSSLDGTGVMLVLLMSMDAKSSALTSLMSKPPLYPSPDILCPSLQMQEITIVRPARLILVLRTPCLRVACPLLLG